MQTQLPFGQPLFTGNLNYPAAKTVVIETGNIIVRKVRNGYVLHVHDTVYVDPKVYVCSDAEDVGEALKVALVNLRIDAAK